MPQAGHGMCVNFLKIQPNLLTNKATTVNIPSRKIKYAIVFIFLFFTFDGKHPFAYSI